MPASSSQIVIGGTGKVYVAPVGTAAPADHVTAWVAAWVDLGYTSEDGVTFGEARSVESIAAWQAFNPVRRIVTSIDTTIAFVLRQWSKDTVKLAFGGGTITQVAAAAGPPAIAAHSLFTPPDPSVLDERAVGLEWVDGTKIYRLTTPKAILTEGVETNIARTAASDLPLTMGVVGTDGATAWTLRTNDPSFV